VTRGALPNCGNKIISPGLGITRDLAPGEAVIFESPAIGLGELRFACGMGMYKRLIVAQ
jgi:plastocyanin domain-containing protein